MWRKEFDLLSSDATTVSNELNNQLRAATQYIRTFSENNKEIFSSMSKFKDVLDSLVKYSEVQASCYKDLKDEIKELKQVQIKNQADSAKLNADLLTAVREMIGAVKTLKD
jgi:ABC-type transporter Mla subunit MlaD